jgi:hypothetical protein
MTGMMSEAELHHLKQRMHAGARHKAERGELHQGLPVGLARGLGGEVILNPDEEVQARIRLVFEKFREIRSAGGVMRYLQETHLPLPARPLRGPAPHEVIWQPASTSSILDILHNPAYAGAYVYGRKTLDPAQRTPAHPHGGRVELPVDKWDICLHNRYPAYISWEEFGANQTQLRTNSLRYREERPGVARKGQALTSRDRALWTLRGLTAPALLWSAGRVSRLSLQRRPEPVWGDRLEAECERLLWMPR